MYRKLTITRCEHCFRRQPNAQPIVLLCIYLTHPRTEGNAESRSEGAELRTDTAATIRAARGLRFSTEARTGASDSQLARSELISHLQIALELLKILGDSAERRMIPSRPK